MRVVLDSFSSPEWHSARFFSPGAFLIQEHKEHIGIVYQRVAALNGPGLVCVNSGVEGWVDDGKLYRALRPGERVIIFGEV